MARRKRAEEHENHERWLISYADFITLLFAFFVVMYSISSVNEGKYRVLSDAIVAAFRAPAKSLQPIQTGKVTKSPSSSPINLPHEYRKKIEQLARERQQQVAKPLPGAGGEQMRKIAGEIKAALKALINKDQVKVREGGDWLEIEMKANILFPSGSAALLDKALPVLRDLAKVLRPHSNQIQVEGHTDDRPIRSLVYPSNWELSASRAASVVQMFSQYGVKPQRMGAVGYGEYRPVADNKTAVGRQQNRRVALVVLATLPEALPERPTPAAEAQRPKTLSPIAVPLELPNSGVPQAPPATRRNAP